MKRIMVRLKERSYPILIGPYEKGLVQEIRRRFSGRPSRILLVSSPSIARRGHVARLNKVLSRLGVPISVAFVPDGEAHKTTETLLRLFHMALKNRLDRKSLVVAMGGGVITDMAGFFAATYMRGISYVAVPTTLLGMVDAAIGGKTAVDLPGGKNLFGAFWQPLIVSINPTVLRTLPEREWRTGMAEVVKYGVIQDADFFRWLVSRTRQSSDPRTWSAADVVWMIATSAGIKAGVVSADEKERPLAGGREILNFGHTIGHALEAATGYRTLTHGEAISIGMVLAGRMALKCRLWSDDLQLQLVTLLETLRLPIAFPKLTARQKTVFWSSLKKDKKHVGGRLRFVLPVRLGHVSVTSGISVSLLKSVLS